MYIMQAMYKSVLYSNLITLTEPLRLVIDVLAKDIHVVDAFGGKCEISTAFSLGPSLVKLQSRFTFLHKLQLTTGTCWIDFSVGHRSYAYKSSEPFVMKQWCSVLPRGIYAGFGNYNTVSNQESRLEKNMQPLAGPKSILYNRHIEFDLQSQ